MINPRVYVHRPLVEGDCITLAGQAAHHLVVVLRMRNGSVIRVFDGAGHEHQAILTDVARGKIKLNIGTALPGMPEPVLLITLAQGIARHDRMDMILQKAVELGVRHIQPLWLQRSQSHLKGERLEKRLQHWQGILVNACEQCGRNTLPRLLPPAGIVGWLEKLPAASLRVYLQPDSSTTLNSLSRPSGEIILLVGPEGGMNTHELSLARSAGFTGIRLGPRILRTETAALAAIAGLQMLWGDFR